MTFLDIYALGWEGRGAHYLRDIALQKLTLLHSTSKADPVT